MVAKNSGYSPQDMINRLPVRKDTLQSLIEGQASIVDFLCKKAVDIASAKMEKVCRIAIDAHLGVSWQTWINLLEKTLNRHRVKSQLYDISRCLKPAKNIEISLQPYLPDDPTFGRIYDGKFDDFFVDQKIFALRKKLLSSTDTKSKKIPFVIICYGVGSTGMGLDEYYDAIFYIDLCREAILKRLKLGIAHPLGAQPLPSQSKKSSGDALPAYFSTRRFYYVDYPVLDKHRTNIFNEIDYYIDGNDLKNPKMIPGADFRQILDDLVKGPVKPKPYYDPSPWGGQWLKRVRKLPRSMPNCAWSYDLIEPETSFLLALGESCLEIPFPVLTHTSGKKLVGKKGGSYKYCGQFPIRINYDDSYDGGDMALQCHPDNKYIKKHFNEPFRQDESYYIVDSKPGSKVYLGLKEDIDIEEFQKDVFAAEERHIPFDHNKYVNSLPSTTGDLFLIPAGTLHGSGKDETVLEISATTYRYTFHFYDYLRPGLDGKLRSIHAKHAFAALKTLRRTQWVLENLKLTPRLIRKGKGWIEYLLGIKKEMFYKVHRLEFENTIFDDTNGEFHLLVLVAGQRIIIRPDINPEFTTQLPFSCLAVIPAAVGKYTLKSMDGKPCKVVKVLMR